MNTQGEVLSVGEGGSNLETAVAKLLNTVQIGIFGLCGMRKKLL